VQNSKEWNAKLGIYFFVIFIVFGAVAVWNPNSDQGKSMKLTKELFPEIYTFVNLALYGNGIMGLMNLWIAKNLKPDGSNLNFWARVNSLTHLVKIPITCYGIH
jgi:hypothetical protein